MRDIPRSPDGSTVLVRYYSLGSDTATPSGLYARLCHAFLVFDTLLSVLLNLLVRACDYM